MRTPIRIIVPAAVAASTFALLGAGCGSGTASGAAGTDPGSTSRTGTNLSSGKARTVKLHVVQGGKHGATLALVPVTIDGKGPFVFALDTGAAQSLIGRSVAKKLGLTTTGSSKVSGVACTTKSYSVKVKNWKVGNVSLPVKTVASVALPGSSSQGGLQGLLGSDVLSDFGAITVDYEAQTLTLRPKQS